MKKAGLFLGVAIVVAIFVVLNYGQDKLIEPLGANLQSSNVLIGTDQNFGRMASSTTFGDTVLARGTSTPFYIPTTTQMIVTEGYDKVKLLVSARGGTATSTLSIRQMVSDNGTDYFDLSNSTSTDEVAGVGTTTPSIAPRAIEFDPGIATTSMVFSFDVYGYRYTRFLLTGEDATGDPNDGTFAWITAVSVK